MTLRDIQQLSQIIDTQISYGLEIDKSVLLEFEKEHNTKTIYLVLVLILLMIFLNLIINFKVNI